MGEAVDRALLEHLDEALEAVTAVVPWAQRSDNRVVWSTRDGSPDPIDPPAAGLAELDRCCHEISAADVGNGWFVHPADRRQSGPSVPTLVDGLGRCTPFGSSGGGDWLVIAADGAVWMLPPSAIHDGRYEPGPVPISRIAGSVREFVEIVLAAARDV